MDAGHRGVAEIGGCGFVQNRVRCAAGRRCPPSGPSFVAVCGILHETHRHQGCLRWFRAMQSSSQRCTSAGLHVRRLTMNREILMLRFPARLAFSLALSLSLLCAAPLLAASKKKTPTPEITVLAAASLQGSLDTVSEAWTRVSGQSVRISYASSAALARQIEQGVPADLFISADTQWMDHLQQRALIDAASRVDLLGNRLVLVAPAASPLRKVALTRAGLDAALGKDRLAMAETASVPAGRYGRQSLVALGLWQGVSNRLAEGDSVRAALNFVARAETPLGIVYATDARAEPKVRVVAEFPERTHARIVYPAARIRAADPRLGLGFLRFLQGRQAQQIFRDDGFRSP